MLHKKVYRFFLVFLILAILSLGTYVGHASAQSANPFIGKWGYAVLSHGGSSSWYTWKTETGTMTVNNDWSPAAPGTATSTYMESADICPDQNYCMVSDTTPHFYTVNPDGTATLDGVMKLVLSNDGKVVIGDGTSIPGEQTLFLGVKLDPAHAYTLADAVGDYYSGSYEYDALGTSPPSGGGRFRLLSVVSSLMSDSTFSMTGTANGDGIIYNIPVQGADPRQFNGTYSIDPSGLISIFSGFGEPVAYGYSGDGAVGVFSNAKGGPFDDFRVDVTLRRQDRTYSTADLQGTWAVSTFGETGGTAFRTEFGTITCDNVGSCSASLKAKDANDAISDVNTSLSLSAAADGSINGFYLTNAMPNFSGAIGNNGNTMLLVMNTSSQNTNDRASWIAVKTSASAATTGCSTYNLFTNTLHIPCYNPGGPPTYWLDLAIRPSNTLMFQVSNFGQNTISIDNNQATLNLVNMALHVPCLDLGSLPTYWLDLGLVIEGNTILFNLNNFGQN
jgi:hypothetical protein